MTEKILVTYATCTGSTVGVAEAIGKTLAESGLEAEVLPMAQVKDMTQYRAVVAGSPIQDKKWLPEAIQFVEKNQAELSCQPFAAFLVCLTLAMRNGESYRAFVAEFLAPVRTLVKPVSEGQFAGILDFAKIPNWRVRLMFRLSTLFGVWQEGDHRDWNAIRAWAKDLPSHFGGKTMTAKWTAENIPNLTGKIAIVTGANSGIGYETARALAAKRATVILVCRSPEKGAAAVRQVKKEFPKANAELLQLDLSDLASIRRFANKFTSRHDRLDFLINNAGVMRPPFSKTTDGFELQFGANHLGHFALTGLLLDLIIHTPQARVVTVSSSGHRFGQINFDNLNAEQGYDAGQAYGQSKLANLLFTYELQRRFAAAGLETLAVAAHPGWTATNLAIHWPMVQRLTPLIGQPPGMGALPTLYAATAPSVQGSDYYGPGGWLEMRGYPAKVQSSATSHHLATAARLWEISEQLTGFYYPAPIGNHQPT